MREATRYAYRAHCPQCHTSTDHLQTGEAVVCTGCQSRLVWARCRFLAGALTDWPDEVRTRGPVGGQFGVPRQEEGDHATGY